MKKQNTNRKNKRKNRRQDGKNIDGRVINIQRFNSNKMVFFKDIVPPRVMTKLKFICNRKMNNAGLSAASIQFNANGLFDFDPALASNKVAGFDELVNIWGRYRVYALKADVWFTNLDTVTNIVNVGFEPEVHAANTKSLAHFDGPNQKTRQTSNGGQTPVHLQIQRNALAVVGDEIVYTEYSYTGTGLSNPSSIWYVSVAADCSAAGGTFTNGVAIRAEFEICVEFFERYELASAAAVKTRKGIIERQLAEMRAKELSIM